MDDYARRLEAVRAWLYLGLAEEAALELDTLAEARQLAPDVLKTRARVLQALHQWRPLRDVARRLCAALPQEPRWPLLLATVTRHLDGPECALGILQEAAARFPSVSMVSCELACCEALSGMRAQPEALAAGGV